MKKQSLFFVLGIVLIGTVLRSPFTALPTILGDIAQGLGVEVSSLGILTSLPSLDVCSFFGFCESLGTKKSGWNISLLTVSSSNCWLCHFGFSIFPFSI